MSTAVVILNWNGSAMLRRFLPSVIHYSDDARIIVADNASTDDSVEVLCREFPQVEVIQLDANYGFAEGYNRALSQVEADYVVLLNSDVEVTPHWLAPLTDYLDNHPQVVACQPKLLSYHRKSAFEYAGAAGGFMDAYGYPFCRGRLMAMVEEDQGQYDTVLPVFWATGAALCIRLEAYRRVGGLDGRFFAHMEEIDLCWRLGARGMGLVCIPQSVVYHVGGATLQKENPRKTYLNFRNNLLMLYKNLPDSRLHTVMRVRCCLDYVAACKFLLCGQWPNARAVWQARRDYHRLLPEFRAARRANLQAAVTDTPVGLYPFSLLFRYYVKGIRRFGTIVSTQIGH